MFSSFKRPHVSTHPTNHPEIWSEKTDEQKTHQKPTEKKNETTKGFRTLKSKRFTMKLMKIRTSDLEHLNQGGLNEWLRSAH